MKNLKTLLAVAMIAVFSFALTGCGDPDPEPNPPTPAYIGYWKFESAIVTPKSGAVYTITSLCSDSRLPQFNIEFDLTSETTAIQKSPCFDDASLTYVSTIVDGELVAVDFKDSGSIAHSYDNIVVKESAKTITGRQTFPVGTSSNIIVKFKLQ